MSSDGLLSPTTARTLSVADDRAVVDHMVRAELALLRAFVAAGVAEPSITAAADAVALSGWVDDIDVAALARASVAGGNPVIPLLPLLRERIAAEDPDAAAWVHRGATSQDILDTALMTLGRTAAERVQDALGRTAASLVRLAVQHRDAPAAARTLTQHAVPTTIGARVAGWVRAIVGARLAVGAAAAALPAQLAGAGGTLASFVELFGPEDAARMPALYAVELGLRPPDAPWHTDRRPVTGLADALAEAVAALGTFASDVATLSRTEIAEVTVGAGGGSSAMPQKQNPVDAVLVRAAAMRAPGLAAQLHLSAGLAVDERPDGAWHAEWPAFQELLQLAVGAADRAADLAAGLSFDPARARRNLDLTGGLIVSERLGIVLVPRIGTKRFDALIADASGGSDLATLLRELPETEGLDIEALVDPAGYTGLAGILVDEAVRYAREEGIRP